MDKTRIALAINEVWLAGWVVIFNPEAGAWCPAAQLRRREHQALRLVVALLAARRKSR